MESGTYRYVVNEMLVEIFQDILKLEQRAIAGFSDVQLTMSEMHIVEAVGKNRGQLMGDIARGLRITLPTLTVSVDRLVEKGFLKRQRAARDKRRVEIELTERGVQAFDAHEHFHARMVQSLFDEMNIDRMPVLMEALTMLSRFFKDLARQQDG